MTAIKTVGELIKELKNFDPEMEIKAMDGNGESEDQAIQFLKPRIEPLEEGGFWGSKGHSFGENAVALPFFK